MWDEENRLLALSDNGFVSNYWYDAAGERTVKESGVGQGVSVNGLLSGGITGTINFTAYISPYLVLNNGGYYTKHIYMGSQRIVSKLGSSDIFTIRNPLTDTTANNQNFVPKLTDLTGKIKVRFDSLGVVYKGTSQGNVGMITSTAGRIPTPLKYYFHSDHLGSSSLITDATGGIVQHLEYIPFGEVFIDERAATSTWSTPYKFNAKELDEETGLYYYGARYYDPRTSVWISVDPLAEKYVGRSSYEYCFSNPVKIIDPTGMGGELAIDEKNKTMTIKANLYFYGEKSNKKLAHSLANGIQEKWNAANGTYTDKETGNTYRVNFEVTGHNISKLEAKVRAIFNGDNPQNIFIDIEDMGKASSFTDGYSNSGKWNINQLADNDATTTGTHEFGHSLGIVQKGGNGKGHWYDADIVKLKRTANIMYPRGTNASDKLSFENNNTLDPSHRVVTQISIDQIFLDNPNAIKDATEKGVGKLGEANNIIH